jgi:hypothetical protein
MTSMSIVKAPFRLWRQVLLLWLLLAGGMIWAGQPKPVGESQVKAVFLFNFTKFAYWPANGDVVANSPFVIGVVGEDTLGNSLDEAVRAELVQDRPIVVRRFRSSEAIGPCQILFIARSEIGRLDTVLERVRSQPVLTVADTAHAAEAGVMINLVLVEGSVKMEINQRAVESAGFKISAKLLGLARIVNTQVDESASKP